MAYGLKQWKKIHYADGELGGSSTVEQAKKYKLKSTTMKDSSINERCVLCKRADKLKPFVFGCA